MIAPSEIPSTQAIIVVEDDVFVPNTNSNISKKVPLGNFQPTSTNFINTVSFTYTSDVLQIGDPFTVTIPNPRGLYTSSFLIGSKIQLYLSNPSVNGGAQTLKHLGRIVKRRVTCDDKGAVIQLDCADLGWHLTSSDAPLWYNLQYGTMIGLLQGGNGRKGWIDPTWGIQGLRTTNQVNKLLRQALFNGRQGLEFELQSAVLPALVFLQVEPGDKIADILINYARRLNLLMNVSCDGYLQFWRPDYTQSAPFKIEFYTYDNPLRTSNNVLSATLEEDLNSVYTDIYCVGEIVAGALFDIDNSNQNSAKRLGYFSNPYALPFKRRMNFSDPDIFNSASANAQAKWKYDRLAFDACTLTYVVRGHCQNGMWWESDYMCEVNDEVNGCQGTFYISSVHYSRDENGDRTTVTMHKVGHLAAAFGDYSRQSSVKSTRPITPTLTDQIVGTIRTGTVVTKAQ